MPLPTAASMRPHERHQEKTAGLGARAGGIIESERVKAAPGSNDDEVGLELLEDGQNNQAECSLKSSISKEIDHNQQCYEDNRSRNLVLYGASCVFFLVSVETHHQHRRGHHPGSDDMPK